MTPTIENVTQDPELVRKVNDLSTEAKSLMIRDQHGLDRAGELLKTIKATREEINATFDPIIARAHAAHKEACAQKKRIETPFVEAEYALKSGISACLAEQERQRRERERIAQAEADRQRREAEAEQRRLQEEADRQHAEQIEAEIVQAEERGASPDHIAALANTPAPIVAAPEPVFMPVPYIAPAVQKPNGITTTERWAAHVVSIRQLAAAVGSGAQPENLLIGLELKDGKVSSPTLNKIAAALKTALAIPGVRAVASHVVGARSR